MYVYIDKCMNIYAYIGQYMYLDSYRVISVALGKGAWGEKNTIHLTTNAPTYRRRRHRLLTHICIYVPI